MRPVEAQMTTYIVLLGAFLFGALAARAQAPGVVIRLVDVAEQVGITLLNICGGPSKDYIVEVNGNGAAVFDYDNDGDVDVLIVNGSTLANIKQGAAIRWSRCSATTERDSLPM